MEQLKEAAHWTDVLVLHFGQLGDAVLSLPALDLIRDSLPAAQLAIGCGMPVGELLDIWGRADQILPLDRVQVRDTSRLQALALMLDYVRRVRGLNPQAVLVLHPNREMNLVGWISGASTRMGVVFKPSLFNLLLTGRMAGRWKRQHASTTYFEAANWFCGNAPEAAVPALPLLITGRQPQRDDYIVIHTGAGNRKRALPPDAWVQVARILQARTGRTIAFVSGPEEPGLAEELSTQVPDSIARSRLTMRQLATELSRSSFFIGSDSGPGHLAAALGTPSLTLIAAHMVARYRPLGPRARLLRYEGPSRGLGRDRIVQAALTHPQFGATAMAGFSHQAAAVTA